jgi:hypothetical protein
MTDGDEIKFGKSKCSAYFDGRYDDGKWFLSKPSNADMRIPDEVRKCVVFIGMTVETTGLPT